MGWLAEALGTDHWSVPVTLSGHHRMQTGVNSHTQVGLWVGVGGKLWVLREGGGGVQKT